MAMPDAHIFNLEDALNRTLGNVSFLREMLEEFQALLPDYLAAIQAALDGGVMEQLAKEAHQLKGAAGNLGAPGIAEAALGLEKIGKGGLEHEARQTFLQLQNAVESFVKEIERLDWSATSDPDEGA